MEGLVDRRAVRRRIRYRTRARLSGSAARPRLAVFRSGKHIYAQAIDDVAGITVAAASTLDRELRGAGGGNIAAAQAVGQAIGARLREAGIERVVFDRGGFAYHGRIRALADAARAAGLVF